MEEQKQNNLFATVEAARLVGVSTQTLSNHFRSQRIRPICTGVHNNHLSGFWNFQQIKEAKQYFKEREVIKAAAEKKSLVKEVKEPLDLEELKKLHHLVTNPLFFKLSYFPDVALTDDE